MFPLPAGPVIEMVVPADDDSIYFAMIDRFADGEPGRGGAVALDDPQGWHGGDLAGLTAHVGEIAGMGFKTLWITPITESRDEKFHEWGAYHGYWVDRFDRIDERFGGFRELKALSDELHEHGMRLMLDVVLNHTSFDSPIRDEHPEWFHDAGPVVDFDDPVQRRNGEVHGLPDLDQGVPELREHLAGSIAGLVVDGGVDALRLDAIRHMEPSEVGLILSRIDEHVRGHVPTTAEIFTGDRAELLEEWREGGYDAAFNFPLHYAITETICDGGTLERLGSALHQTALEAPGRWVNFLDNHDLPRVASRCDDAEVAMALTALFAAPGTPMVTWGTEVGADGAEEPENRADMSFGEHPRRAAIASLNGQRRESRALRSGELRLVEVSEDELFAVRWIEDDVAFLAVNRSDRTIYYEPEPDIVAALNGAISWEGVQLPPRSATILTGRAEAPVYFPEAARNVEIALPEGFRGADVKLVGADERFGSWDPKGGLRTHQGVAVVVDAEVGSLLEFKLVRETDGQPEWESGPNRYIFVAPGEGPLQLSLQSTTE